MSISEKNTRKYGIILSILVISILLLSFLGSLIQSDFGNVEVEIVEMETDEGHKLVGKVYKPNSATSSNPSPAALLLHGLNNDKDTQAPLAIELSRRGFVVLALDELNHGDSDDGGDVLTTPSDPSLGAITAFDYLDSLGYVDNANIGLVGHSMGGFSANATAQARPTHKAIAFQAFGPLNITEHSYFNNYLQIWPRYEESFNDTRDEWIDQGTKMIEYNLGVSGFTPSSTIHGTTYGDFNSNTAQRYALIDSTHPGGTWKQEANREIVAWLLQALEGQAPIDAYNEAESQIYYLKELIMLLSLILSIISLVPLVYLLLELEFFSNVTQVIPKNTYYEGTSWWRLATINALIGGITFVIFPFIGVLLFSPVPIFRLLIGNAFLFWFLLNAIIAHAFTWRWKRNQENLKSEYLGGVSVENENKRVIIMKSLLITSITFVYLFLLTFIIQTFFIVELRYMWAFFRVLQPERFLTFVIYAIFISYFFIINGGVFLFGQARPEVNTETTSGLIKWWLLNVYNMLSVIILVFIIEYVPMLLFGTAPLLGGVLDIFWLLGIFLMLIIPEFLALFFLMTLFFRKTGRYYIGSFIATMIAAWVMTNGAFV